MQQKVSKATQKFLALSRKEKAVAVAKDIIKALKTKVIKPIHVYISSNLPYWDSETLELPARENLSKMENCQCCMIGAAMVCTVRLGNSLTLGELNDFNDKEDGIKARKLLRTVFTPRQMFMIEEAYEATPNQERIGKQEGANLTDDQIERCRDFNESIFDDEQRMIAICKNIIKNGGVFKP